MRVQNLVIVALAAGSQCQGQPELNILFSDTPEKWDDSDLHRFVTRPDLTPPKLDVIRHDDRAIEKGYLFLAPYSTIDWGAPSNNYVSQQIGPQIYDQDGELVWSGAEHFRDLPVYDFKTAVVNGTTHLTLISQHGQSSTASETGVGFILDSSYQPVESFSVTVQNASQDMHEFTVLEDWESVLLAGYRTRPEAADWSGKVRESCFQELHMHTFEVVFEWCSLDHVPVTETTLPEEVVRGREIDYFHLNSMDKTSSGDYLISARYADSIHLISGRDGSIIWRLGGRNSSFEQLGFSFSRQHDARIRSQNDSVTVISFLDNASFDDWGRDAASAEMSSMLVIALYTNSIPMVATVVHRYPRPDGEYTGARGNVQFLPNGNVLGGWGDNAYVTEHTPSGEVVYEAIFMSSRFSNYRAYKLNFTGNPLDAPAIKASVQASSGGGVNTAVHTSWNGATEVTRWKFYAWEGGRDVLLGSVAKSQFETTFLAPGFYETVFVEAIDVHGVSLRNSSFESTEVPLGWDEDYAAPGLTAWGTVRALRHDSRAVLAMSFLAGALLMKAFDGLLCAIGRRPSRAVQRSLQKYAVC